MLITRRPSDTLARIGLSGGSNASSVIENSVTRTGTTRLRLQMNSTSGASGGRISSVPLALCAATASNSVDARVDQRLEHRELRRDAERDGVGVAVGEFELVGGVDLGVELDRLDRRPLEPERLRALAAAVAADALHLVAARQRVGVVLQRDRALASRRRRREHDEAAFDEFG